MSYSAEISRANPSCFIFLIDQSGSMGDPFGSGESNRTKADSVGDAINRLLQNLVLKCAKEEGVRDFYHLGVIGYGVRVGSAFSGTLANRDLVPGTGSGLVSCYSPPIFDRFDGSWLVLSEWNLTAKRNRGEI